MARYSRTRDSGAAMAKRIRWALAAGAATAAVAALAATGGAQASRRDGGRRQSQQPARRDDRARRQRVRGARRGSAGLTCIGEGDEQACIAFSSSITRGSGGVATRVVKGLVSGGVRDGTFTTGGRRRSVTANGTIYII